MVLECPPADGSPHTMSYEDIRDLAPLSTMRVRYPPDGEPVVLSPGAPAHAQTSIDAQLSGMRVARLRGAIQAPR
jgi:hypothetical protein